MKGIKQRFIALLACLLGMNMLHAQSIYFLGISPDTRSAAMGNVSTGISPDANAVFWNAARNAFNENRCEVAVNYSPWLRELDSDIKLMAMGSYVRLSERHSLNFGLRHFSFGKLNLMDESASAQGSASPYEFGGEIGYAFKVSPNFSLSVTPKYLSSTLSIMSSAPGQKMSAFTLDLGTYMKHDIVPEKDKAVLSYGLVACQIGNIGNGTPESMNLPSIIRGGLSLNYATDVVSAIAIASDINQTLNRRTSGRDYPKGGIGLGTEYTYKDILAVRLGYAAQKYEIRTLNSITTGIMLGYQGWQFGFAYLIPTNDKQALNNTMRFSVAYVKK